MAIVYFDLFLLNYATCILPQAKIQMHKQRDVPTAALCCLHCSQKFIESQQIDISQLISEARSIEFDGYYDHELKAEEIAQLEIYLCQNVLQWSMGSPCGIRCLGGSKLVPSTIFELAIYASYKWDEFVMARMGWLIEQGFQMLFWPAAPPKQAPVGSSARSSQVTSPSIIEDEAELIMNSCKAFNTLMQFIDHAVADGQHYSKDPPVLVASCMYLMLGGKDVMGTFNYDYNLLGEQFLGEQGQFPIPSQHGPSDVPIASRHLSYEANQASQDQLSDSTIFYNGLVEQYLLEHFGLNLHNIRDTVKFVIRYFQADVDVNKEKE